MIKANWEERCDRFRYIMRHLCIGDGHPYTMKRFVDEWVKEDRITTDDARYLCGLTQIDETAELCDEQQVEKPPLGIMPRNVWNNMRLLDLEQAMARYLDAGTRIPKEWIEEYNELWDVKE